MTEDLGPKRETESMAEALGRTAGRFVKTAKPRLKEAAEAARPRIEGAVQSAAQFARDHEDEIKDAATGLVKSRLPLPLRGAVDAVTPKAAPAKKTTSSCAQCGHENPAASKFCNQCGAVLA